MEKLGNYVCGQWVKGSDDGQLLYDATTGEAIFSASTEGLNFKEIVDYARGRGNPALRCMTLHERGRMLRALALYLLEKKESFYQLSYKTGATRADSWIDIEGGIGNIFSNASLRRRLPDEIYAIDGEPVILGRQNTFIAQHILLPKEGTAIHINAYNFPVWGMLEKIAVNLLAGMPAIVKPATVTSFLTEAVVREIVNSGILPDGALQLLCGSTGDLLDHVNSQDVITFTGSASTGLKLKSGKRILEENVPFNLEADSLNCMVLAPDVTPDMPEWDLFVKELCREITVKAGQKCTAVRRIFVPGNKIDAIRKSITDRLSKTLIGNPLNEQVRMGPLAGKNQVAEVRSQLEKLLKNSEIFYGSLETVELVDASEEVGAFLSPIILYNEKPHLHSEPHNIEAFGPVSSLMPYSNIDEAIHLSKLGKGSLCSSIITNNTQFARKFVLGAATHHGRILVLNRDCARENTGHGSPLPMLVHGGPGRAGGGEEMGGLRGLHHYMQRTAVQGSPTMITAVTNVFQANAKPKDPGSHPFRKYFEELEIGEQLITGKRLITSEDIDSFADLSGDHFYAHNRETNFEGTMFEQQVAHGYFIMSAAAGLFVDDFEVNPVLLNYGIDELRFTKPMYAGNSIYVRFTCKEKTSQELKEIIPGMPMVKGQDIPKGIVKWLVEIFDETDELAGLATILTMVRMKD